MVGLLQSRDTRDTYSYHYCISPWEAIVFFVSEGTCDREERRESCGRAGQSPPTSSWDSTRDATKQGERVTSVLYMHFADPVSRADVIFYQSGAALRFLLIRASFAARRKFAQGVTFLANWPQRLSTLSRVSRTPDHSDTIGSTGAAGSAYRDRWLDRERLWMSVQASLIFSLARRNQKLVVRVTKTVNTGLHPVPGWRRYSRIPDCACGKVACCEWSEILLR